MHRGLRIAQRALYGIFAGLIGVMTVLQGNDPDPWRWMAVYGLAAAFCGTVACGWAVPPRILGGYLVLVLAYAGFIGIRYFGGYAATPMFEGHITPATPWWKIEQPRETVGLLATAFLVGTLLPFARMRSDG